MRERLTARVVLLDKEDRVLLIRARPTPEKPFRWFTVGGGAEPGETVHEAALREAVEETGFADIELGPLVWQCDRPGRLHTGEPFLFLDRFVVGRCAGGPINRAAWEEHEHSLMDEARWWSLEDLRATDEVILPVELARLLEDVIAGRYPAEPIRLAVS